MQDVFAVTVSRPYRLWLRFEDGLEGEVDLSGLSFTGVFAPLKDLDYFAQVRVEPELGTVVWPNGADLDPQVLYRQLVQGLAGPVAKV